VPTVLDEYYWDTPSREEVARDNLQRLRGRMIDRGIDAVIVNRSDNLRYVTGVMPTDNLIFTNRQAAVVFAHADQPVMFAASHYADRVARFWIKDVRSLPRVQETWGPLFRRALAERGVDRGTVLLDPYMYYATARRILEALPGANVSDAGSLLAEARALKSETEIAVIDQACSLAEISLAAGFEAAREGIQEVELAARMSEAALAANAEGLYARRGSLVSSGNKLSYHMESPTQKRLRRGDFVLLDVGPMLKGYYCDFARTIFIGDPTPQQVEIYRTAYTALWDAIKAVRPGVQGHELDQICREAHARGGFAEHGAGLVGHGTGCSAQEPPYIVAQEFEGLKDVPDAEDVVLKPNMVLALSTGVFVPDVGGCRFEEDVLVTNQGYRVLGRAPYPGAERFLA